MMVKYTELIEDLQLKLGRGQASEVVPPVVEDGLIFYVDAARSSSYSGSGTVWNDISGSNRNVTLFNNPTYTSEGGGMILFDGTNDRAVTTNNFNPVLSEKTMVAWVRVDDINSTGGGVIGVGYDLTTPFTYAEFDAITYNETNDGWGFGSDSFSRTFWTGVKETSNTQYVMITAVYKEGSNNYKMYRNDELIGQGTENILPINRSDAYFWLGYRTIYGNYEGYFDGSIGVGMIYDRALSLAEVQQNFEAFKERVTKEIQK
jgi:hypothetical protein